MYVKGLFFEYRQAEAAKKYRHCKTYKNPSIIALGEAEMSTCTGKNLLITMARRFEV